MNIMTKSLIMGVLALTLSAACTQAKTTESKKENLKKVETVDIKKCKRVEIKTTLGTIEVALYNETPKHRDNFIKLAKEGYYDGVLFHRVIDEFMCQAGDGNSKTATVDTGRWRPGLHR